MKQVFVAATRQNTGKTVVSLGLLRAFERRGQKIGYMKPVGQSYRIVDNEKIDKDVVLMNAVVGLNDSMSDMSPIAIPQGFTEAYIANPNRDKLAARITAAYGRVSKGKDLLLIEGTGHAGVGSVFDMSNADVARLLDTKVVLVSQGGIGKPIDEIMMNKSKFDVVGATVAGVIVNKVDPDRYDRIAPLVVQGLSRLGLEVFGVLPYDDYLSNPSMAEICSALDGVTISGHAGLSNTVAHFMVGDMGPDETVSSIRANTLLLVPGNREEIVLAAVGGRGRDATQQPLISGIVFTCGIAPPRSFLEQLATSAIPMVLVKENTFAAASSISSMLVKLHAEDRGKIERVDAMIEKHICLDRLVAAL